MNGTHGLDVARLFRNDPVAQGGGGGISQQHVLRDHDGGVGHTQAERVPNAGRGGTYAENIALRLNSACQVHICLIDTGYLSPKRDNILLHPT